MWSCTMGPPLTSQLRSHLSAVQNHGTTSHLSAVAAAAALMAKCRMVLSSRYFCSHLVMSASKARIRSSFSRTSSMRAGALYSGRLAGWPFPCFWKSKNTIMMLQMGHKTSHQPGLPLPEGGHAGLQSCRIYTSTSVRSMFSLSNMNHLNSVGPNPNATSISLYFI